MPFVRAYVLVCFLFSPPFFLLLFTVNCLVIHSICVLTCFLSLAYIAPKPLIVSLDNLSEWVPSTLVCHTSLFWVLNFFNIVDSVLPHYSWIYVHFNVKLPSFPAPMCKLLSLLPPIPECIDQPLPRHISLHCHVVVASIERAVFQSHSFVHFAHVFLLPHD